jgi:TPR repeat protein
MFRSGRGGLPRDPALAFSWFARAAGQGEGTAMAYVSLCYEAGAGDDAARTMLARLSG